MTKAPAPSRSTNKLILTIGMLTLALDLFTAVEESSIRRSMYTKAADGTLHKVGLTKYDTVTGVNIPDANVVKVIETPEGELVELSDEEMQALLTSDNGSCSFIGFLSHTLFDAQYSIEQSYQVRPQKLPKVKQNPHEKPFSLIMDALNASDSVALLSYVSRGKTKFAALDCTGTLYTVRFDEEVREQRPLPVVPISEQELKMGLMFIDNFKLTEAPIFHDEDSAKVMTFVQEKAKTLADGGTVTIPTAATAAPAEAGVDLMTLLAASLNKS